MNITKSRNVSLVYSPDKVIAANRHPSIKFYTLLVIFQGHQVVISMFSKHQKIPKSKYHGMINLTSLAEYLLYIFVILGFYINHLGE